MPAKLHPKEADRYREIARAVLGSGPTWQAGAFVVGIAVGANLLSAFVLDLSHWLAGAAGTALIIAVLWRVSVLAARAEESLEPVVATNENPAQCKALVLFLSNAPKSEVLENWMTDPAFSGGIESRRVQETMDGASWRMPVQAIAYHLAELKKVIVIPSRDDERPGKVVPGTIRDYPKFADLLKRLFEGEAEPPEYLGLQCLSGRWQDGVSFEDAPELVEALLTIFRYLREKHGLNRSDIMVDVTSGTKVTTVAGAAVSLGKRQRFEYVSTQDYKICHYDVTYRRDVE